MSSDFERLVLSKYLNKMSDGGPVTPPKLIGHKNVGKYALHGLDAIRAVEDLEGRSLSLPERRVVELEGFVPELYVDSKGVKTFGVGQTKEFVGKGFKHSFDEHVDRTEKRVPSLRKLPEEVQAELIQAEYRGDLGLSDDAVKLFNKGKYADAAKEFLNHNEYKGYIAKRKKGDKKAGGNIPERLEAVRDAMLLMDELSKPKEEFFKGLMNRPKPKEEFFKGLMNRPPPRK